MGSFGAILLPVAREKGLNRANPKPFALSAFPSTFLAVIRRVISVTPYNLFTTDSWSSSVSGVFPLSYIFPFSPQVCLFFLLSSQCLLESLHILPVPLKNSVLSSVSWCDTWGNNPSSWAGPLSLLDMDPEGLVFASPGGT